MRRRWRWPILGALLDVFRAVKRNWRDGEELGWWTFMAGIWLVAVVLLALLASAIWWVAPHTNNIEIWGAHPRPGFWILMVGAAPTAVVITWAALAWVMPAVLKALLLFVPRREPPQSAPLKSPDEIAARERELGIGDVQ